MKLTQLIKENEERPLSNEVKKHFLEIVSTYNKYQESMDRKSDIIKVAETLGGITEAARTLAIREGDDWFDKHTIKRNMSELDKLGKQFDKVALEAKALDQRMGGLYEDMGHILSRYYKIGEITEDQMRDRLGISESSEPCGCGGGCGCNESVIQEDIFDDNGFRAAFPWANKKELEAIYKIVYSGGSGGEKGVIKKYSKDRTFKPFIKKATKLFFESVVTEQAVTISKRTESGNIVTRIKEENELNEKETALYEFGQKVETLMEKNCPTNPSKWSSYKSQAKQKFDVYPSAYANGWAAKKYKAAGGGWKKC